MRLLTLFHRFTLILMAIFSQVSFAEPSEKPLQFNMTPGVTEISQSIYSLHMIIFWICVAIAVVVFGVMFYSIIMHRKSKGSKAADFHENTTIEVIWTVIPFIILIVMAVPATNVLLEMDDTKDADVDILITGYQWKWNYEYLNEDIKFISNLSTPIEQIENELDKGEYYLAEVDQPLVIPINKKIRFLVTAQDVIHSWWVPSFGVKKDAIPGFINEAWTKVEKPGIYRGACTELCGKGHAFMPVVVEAKTEEDYQAWLVDKKAEAEKLRELTEKDWTEEELFTRGKEVYATNCASCHQVNGEGFGSALPALKNSPIATGEKQKHIDIVINGGAPGSAMQAYGNLLSEVDLAAVITYERRAWGNNAPDIVIPKDILEFKQAQEN